MSAICWHCKPEIKMTVPTGATALCPVHAQVEALVEAILRLAEQTRCSGAVVTRGGYTSEPCDCAYCGARRVLAAVRSGKGKQ